MRVKIERHFRGLVLLAALAWAAAVNAQTVFQVIPAYPNLPPGCVGQPYGAGTNAVVMQLNNPLPAGASVTWRWTVSQGGSPLCTATNTCSALGLTLNASTGAITGTVSSLIMPPASFDIEVQPNPSGFPAGTTPPANRTYRLVVNGTCNACPAKDIALVLDQSGSMASGTPTRWDVLKSNVSNYLLTLRSSGRLGAGDRLAVYIFEGETVTRTVNSNFGTAPYLGGTAAQIEAAVFGSLGPAGMTPIGGAVQYAINDFFGPDLNSTTIPAKVRTLILFTDGMQNKNPIVTGSGNDRIELDDVNYTPLGGIISPAIATGVGHLPMNLASNPLSRVRIFTIGVGATPAFRTLLEGLSNPNNLYQQSDVLLSDEVERFFSVTIPYSLRDCSPRLLDIRSNTLQGKEAPPVMERFTVNKFVENLTLRITADPKVIKELRTELRHNGQLLDIGPSDRGPGILIYTLDFPFAYAGGFVPEDGEWSLGLRGPAGGVYTVTALVDDEVLRHDLVVNKVGGAGRVYTGDDIRVGLTVKQGARPVTNAVVKALVLRPGDDLGDLAAGATVASTANPLEPNTPSGQTKIDLLMNDPAFVAKLEKDGQLKTLTHKGNGVYAADFASNKVSGTYQIITRCNGKDAAFGDYQGYDAQCVLFDFADPSDVALNGSRPTRLNASTFNLSVKPTNFYLRRLGPGQANRIRLQVKDTGKEGKVEDLLDGTYRIAYPANGAGEPVRIWVGDQDRPVYDGPATGARKVKNPWELSLHAGVSFPLGDLDSLYNPSAFGELDFGYRLSSLFSVEAVGGYYAFQESFGVGGGAALLRGHFALKPLGLSVVLAAGGGIYQPKNGDATFGYNLRAGLDKAFNRRWSFAVEGAYFGLPEPEINFATLGLSAHYHF